MDDTANSLHSLLKYIFVKMMYMRQLVSQTIT